MNNKEVFGVKTIQSLLREVKLYGGRIDALFGSSSVEGIRQLVAAANPGYSPIVAVPVQDQASDIFKWVQEYMVRSGRTDASFKVDGLWGSASEGVLKDLVENYRVLNKLPKLSYAWTSHPNLTKEVVAKVEAWMVKWGKPLTHVDYLFSCFALETGRTFNPAETNRDSGAVGLIQFMPKGSMIDLGTNSQALKAMTVLEQLDYVFSYFEKYGYIKKCVRLEDYYLSIFYPARVGTDPNAKLGVKGTKLYEQNSGFDREKKGYYTVGDIAYAITGFYWEGMDPAKRFSE